MPWWIIRLAATVLACDGDDRTKAAWVVFHDGRRRRRNDLVHAFIAMLAYQVGAPVVVNPVLTLLSLLIAMVGCGFGCLIAVSSFNRQMPMIGGAVVGLAASAMHYVGMEGYRIDGIETWDGGYVIASICLAVVFCSAAVAAAHRHTSGRWTALGPALIAVAIISLHFAGMAAVTVVSMPGNASSSIVFSGFSVAVVAVGLIIVGAGVTSFVLHDRESAAILEQYQQLAFQDPLTGMPNRRNYHDHLRRQLRGGGDRGLKLGVVGIDLDRFKEVNDTFGHAAGDSILKIVAERLAGLQRSGEFFARLGGDEFAAFKCFSDQAQILEFTTRIEAAVLEPCILDGLEVALGVSIGVAIYPKDGTDPDTLASNANLAMSESRARMISIRYG